MKDRSFRRSSGNLFATAADAVVALINSTLFPQQCSLCGFPANWPQFGDTCSQCWSTTALFDDQSCLCPKCGSRSPEDRHCGRCNDHFFDQAIAVGPYENALREAVIRLKSTPQIPRILAERSVLRLQVMDRQAFDLIVPVPLSKRRRFERGFNQAEIIADAVSRSASAPVDRRSLQRNTHTQIHRVGMDRKARERTVAKAFDVVRPQMVTGRKILLVDDVLTSGATASACAKALKTAGAASVCVFTLASAEFRRG